MFVERLVQVSAISVVAIFAVLAAAVVLDVIPGNSLFEEAEPAEIAQAHRTPEGRDVERKARSGPVIRVINAGTVDEDPTRHADAVAALERASREPAAIVTDDDDLTPTGSYADWYSAKLKTYRTVCVRMCDGAITPISFATSQDRLALDALRCRKSCGSPAKLYVQKNPSSDIEGLVDLEGKPYASLATAFKFRTSYDDACTCRPHAWQSIAQARHRLFEIQSRLRNGRQVVQGRLAVIRSAAFRSLPVAVAARAPQSAIVTGSAGGQLPVGPAGDQVAAAEQVEPETVAPSRLKSSRKASGQRKSKAAALAKAKAARAKAEDAALLVLFGPSETTATGKPNKLSSVVLPLDSVVKSAASTRRYDGNDWRISAYEPL